jgi:hypothetical protein
MPAGERAEARAAVERQNAIEVPDRDADTYRLAPQESRLDWLDAQRPARAQEPNREDRLDWLNMDNERGRGREPERDRER